MSRIFTQEDFNLYGEYLADYRTTRARRCLESMFSLLDLNSDGKLSRAELRAIGEEFGNAEQLEGLIDIGDSNQDDVLDLEEFVKLFEMLYEGR